MFQLTNKCRVFGKNEIIRFYCSAVSTTNKLPEYPPILDLSYLARRKRRDQSYYEKFKSVGTVEEKQIAVNMPRRYGFPCCEIKETVIPPQALEFIQHCTRTHIIVKDTLPEYYLDYDTPASFIAKELKSEIEDAIHFEFQCVKRKFPEDASPRQKSEIISTSVLKQINRIITNHLASKLPHIMDCQTDLHPRVEASWIVGGFDAPTPVKKSREGRKSLDVMIGRPYSNYIQFWGDPVITVRSELPLEPIFPASDASNPSLEVPTFNYNPLTRSYFFKRQHVVTIPGFWPGDSHEFGLLSYHKRDHLLDRFDNFGPDDKLEALHCQAISTSFAWLFGQCSYQGFTTFNEITYPLVTQTIISDGQFWSFYTYQLNTIALIEDNITENPLRNICCGTKPMKLFEGIDDNGKIVGFNEDVLKMVIQFYINAPKERVGVNMKPYLNPDAMYVAQIEHDEKRNWLEKTYKEIMSRRPDYNLPYEIYLWEHIYKINFDTRLQDARRRPFETFGPSPLQEPYTHRNPKYVPKCLRPDLPKKVGKRINTYYPNVKPDPLSTTKSTKRIYNNIFQWK